MTAESPTVSLRVSPTVALPIDLVTESNGILGKKGSGKTSAGVVLYEEMYRAGVPVVAVDPKGDWYGIRASSDGTQKGLPVPVFGGRHGDIPLEATAGTLIADLILDRQLSCVLDVSEFSLAERRRFLTPFADRLYRAAERNPMHVFLEESHEYIPQFVKGDDAAMVGMFERLVKNGRFKGIGVTLLSQRSASLNKNVLTQIDNLFVMRTVAAQDRAAVKGWVEIHADASEILASLPSLQTGETWLWQPGRGEPAQFRFRMRDTFDAGATPKVGETRATPTNLADVDLTALAAAMAETIEKAKADDPAELRKQLRTSQAEVTRLREEILLKQELAAARAIPEPERIEVPVIDDMRLEELDRIGKSIYEGFNEYRHATDHLFEGIREALRARMTPAAQNPAPRPLASIHRPVPAPAAVTARPAGDDIPRLAKAQRAILTVLAQRGTQTVQQVATLSGYAVGGGGFNNAIGSLRSAGYVIGSKEALQATQEGIDALGSFEPLPSGRALVEYWLGKFGKAERLILGQLVSVYPNPLTREELAEATGYAAAGGGFNNAVGKLRSLTLITGGRDAIFADDELGQAWSA